MKKMISTTTSEMWKFDTAGFSVLMMVVLLLMVAGTIGSVTGSATESEIEEMGALKANLIFLCVTDLLFYDGDVYGKPEQVEEVLSLKAALYGTVIATYTVASNIACIIIIHNNEDCNEIWTKRQR